jgi:hypothetical protein
MTTRGFGRLIEAVKGVAKAAEFVLEDEDKRIAREHAAPASTAPEQLGPDASPAASSAPPRACAREQIAGWRCFAEGPHTECLLKRDA